MIHKCSLLKGMKLIDFDRLKHQKQLKSFYYCKIWVTKFGKIGDGIINLLSG